MAKKAGSKSRSSKARGEGGKAGRPPFEPVPPLWLAPDDTPPDERARQQAQYERDHAAWKERYDAWWRRRGPPESPAQTREASGRLPPGFLLSEPLPPSYLGPGAKFLAERERERQRYEREHAAWERERQALLRQQWLAAQLDAKLKRDRAIGDLLHGAEPSTSPPMEPAQQAERPRRKGREPHAGRDSAVAYFNQLLAQHERNAVKLASQKAKVHPATIRRWAREERERTRAK